MLGATIAGKRSIGTQSNSLHIFAQIGFGSVGTVCVLFATLSAAQTPAMEHVIGMFRDGPVALACGAIMPLLMVAGILRAIVFALTDGAPKTSSFKLILQRTHRFATAATSLTALAVSAVILVSVIVGGRPTVNQTMFNALVLLFCAALLGWPRFQIDALKRPNLPIHAIAQIAVAGISVCIFERITQALLFHSQQFSTFDAIEQMYPIFENILMLPALIFGLTGIALSLPAQDNAQRQPDPMEVFG